MKNRIKSLAALIMALCIIFSLAACGGGSGNEKSDSGKSSDSEPTPEFTYTSSFKSLRSDSKDDSRPQATTADGFYCVGQEKVGEKDADGKPAEYEGQYDIYEPRISFSTFDGKVTQLENYAPVKAEFDSEGKRDFASSQTISGLLVNPDGGLTVLENAYASWSEAPDDVKSDSDDYYNYFSSESIYYMRTLDNTGAELSSARLDISDSSLYTNNIALDDKGNLVLCSDSNLAAFAPDGSQAYSIPINGYVYSLVKLRDGRVGALTLDMTDYNFTLNIIDPASGAFENKTYIMPNNAYDLIPGGGDYDLYYTSGVNFYGYSLENEQAEKLFNWINCDVDSSELWLVTVNDDGTINGFSGDYDEKAETYSIDYITVTKVPYDSVPHKDALSMAVLYMNDNTQKAIIDFNRSNDKYRIDVTDYSEYNTQDDYSAGLTKLTTEIMAGNMPDIIALDSELPYRQMAAKGLLEDLYPYIDADPELDRDDYFQNVFSALEVNGGLYDAAAGFGIITAVGATSVVGDKPGWTYDDYYAALATMPEGCEGFDFGYDKNNLLTICLALDLDDYMDWSTGECHFDSENFVKLLEFANQGQKEFDYENYEYSAEDSSVNRIKEGKQMLTIATFYSPDFMYGNYSQTFGAPVTCIGFPTMHGVGSMMVIADGYAMSSTCSNKEAAWQFIRTFMTEKYQNDCYYLPTNKNVFEKQLKDAMVVEYQKDPNGNYLLDENGERIPVSKGSVSDGINTYEVYATTEEEAQQLREVTATTTKMMNLDQSIMDIVSEQAAAYFSGQKTAEEVAKLIQSKASIYINEQR